MKYVIIPSHHIQWIEDVRKEIYRVYGDDDIQKLLNITPPLWYVAHRNYKELTFWNYIKFKLGFKYEK